MNRGNEARVTCSHFLLFQCLSVQNWFHLSIWIFVHAECLLLFSFPCVMSVRKSSCQKGHSHERAYQGSGVFIIQCQWGPQFGFHRHKLMMNYRMILRMWHAFTEMAISWLIMVRFEKLKIWHAQDFCL